MYPLQRDNGLWRNLRSVRRVIFVLVLGGGDPLMSFGVEVGLVLVLVYTCAFCLITSAGVKIKQETDSATQEEREWIIGVGRGDCCVVVRVCFRPS